jgi:prolyl-tRNA editing enzyme YbaK/EbsC (Cys-tRNA(Pro) deacylase)
MAIDKVREYFSELGLEDRILEFSQSSETVTLAAQAVGTEPNNIVKTMSFMVDGKPILICLAGEARIANSKFKATFHTKATMLPHDEVGKLIGHEVGGVCPFAVNEGVEVYLDKSLEGLDTVYPAAGSGNSAVRLSVPELERYASPRGWVDVCKDPE